MLDFERDFYAHGLAVCESRILTDTIFFRFRQETFEFPSEKAHSLVDWDSRDYPSCRVSRLRKLKKHGR